MEDEFYHLTVKGNDLKTYVRRFQELATLCPTMVPDSEKMMEVFIGGLPRSIKGNVTASKPQTLEEAINIAQRLMDQKRMPPKRMSTSEAPAMTQAVIRKLVADSVSAALEAQAANMANTDNTTRPREALVARYNCTEDCKVKFATGTLTEEALSWWNYFAQPIGIEEAYKITWVEFKKLLIKKYYPRTEV
ncbi:hypothetical protein Tco_0439324 [Tanacetum coccineum]